MTTQKDTRNMILHYLLGIGGWPVTEQTIAKNLRLKVGTVKRHIDVLLDRGLVVIASCDNNTRPLYRAASATEKVGK